jgi:O-antigen ligase
MTEKKYSFSWTDLQLLFLALFIFFLPFLQKASVVCIVVMFLLWLSGGGVIISLKTIGRDKTIIIFTLFYFAHLAGLIYSSNLPFAYADLQTKLTFFLFPLIFPAFKINKKELARLKWFFISGCFLNVIVCIVLGVIQFKKDHDPQDFFYIKYSYFLHPAYFSFYLNLALLFLIDNVLEVGKWQAYNWWKRVMYILVIYLFAISIVQLSSRTATVVAGLSILLFVILSFRRRNKKVAIIVAACFFLFSLFLIQQITLPLFNRYEQVEGVLKQERSKITGSVAEVPKTEGDNSANLHVKIWTNSIELIKRNFILGVGTGDVKDELKKVYAENNFNRGIESNFNCHNQFLNTTVTLGLSGLIFLLLIFLVGIRVSILYRDWLYFSFLFIMFLNALTESVLEVQSGVLFFAAFNMMFYLCAKSGGIPDDSTHQITK